MKDQSSRKNKVRTANVEFGNEFGDINSAKFYEYSSMNQEKKKKNPPKKK
jgi:hypothetical protein